MVRKGYQKTLQITWLKTLVLIQPYPSSSFKIFLHSSTKKRIGLISSFYALLSQPVVVGQRWES